jgi:hypothetical protein
MIEVFLVENGVVGDASGAETPTVPRAMRETMKVNSSATKIKIFVTDEN